MIQYGDTHSIPELKRLWKVCFEDEDAYINAFFDVLYEDKNVLAVKEDGMLMGASFFLPGKLYREDEKSWQKIRYVYALAVYPQYRGKGIAGKLLRHANKIYHAPLVAQPADEGLVGGFYEPLGFKQAFYLEKEQAEVAYSGVQAAEISQVHPLQEKIGLQGSQMQERQTQEEIGLQGSQIQEKLGLHGMLGLQEKQVQGSQIQEKQMRVYAANAEEYIRIRDTCLLKNGYISWPVRHVAFAIQEHCENGGNALICKQGKREDILLYYMENDQIVVTETTLATDQVTWVFRECIPHRGAGQMVCVWRQSTGQDRFEGGSKMRRLVGMVYGITPVRGYLNLTLD